MLKEAMEYLSGLAVKSAGAQVVHQDLRETTFVVGGELTRLQDAVRPRQHRLARLVDLLAYLQGEVSAGEGLPKPPCEVWLSPAGAVAILNSDGHRDDRVTMLLEHTPIFSWLCEIEEAGHLPWEDQRSFVRTLRTKIRDHLPPGELLERVKRVRFESGTATTGTVARDRESLGRELTSKVEANGDIPEVVTLSVPVFANSGEDERYNVACVVEVDAARGMLALFPLPGELHKAKTAALANLEGRLRAGLPKGVACYQGAPS